MAQSKHPLIAVVGVSALFPGSIDAHGFWKNILEGNDLFSEIPESHWRLEDYYDAKPGTPDKTYAKRGGFMPEVEFDPLSFGVPPNILPATDTAQLLALGVARQVLEDAAGGDFSHMDREKISVVLGVASATELVGHMSSRLQLPIFERVLRTAGLPEDQVKELTGRLSDCYTPWQESTFPGLLGNVVAGRIANRLDLGGTNCVVDAACASSLAALEIAVNELYLGLSDLVITGGVDALNDILMFMCFSQTPALSPSGDCRPFSDQADGTMLGEGIGMIALKRLDDAERDGDPIYAVLRGVGTSSDGRAKSIYAPVSSGQAKALRRCYEVAGYGPETVELVEAHGTGTKAGDAAEFGGLTTVFAPAADGPHQWCALGSVKSQIGHTKASAGAAGLFKAVMALHSRVLPPTIKVDRPNPMLNIEQTAFYLNTQTRPWIRPEGSHPRRASVSSFGFGGTNFHVALEEYTGSGKQAQRHWTAPAHLIALSAATPDALIAQCQRLIEDLNTQDTLAPIAAQSARDFDATHPARLALVAASQAELQAQLEGAVRTIQSAPERPFSTPQGTTYGVGKAPGKVALLFPGQGSQYVGMGDQLAIHFDAPRQRWDEIAAMDGELASLHQVVYPVPVFDDAARQAQEDALTRTERAQPAIGAVSLGLYEMTCQLGLKADMVGGHSYGEIMALHAAGVLSKRDMMRVSAKRGELMAEASKLPGAMTAVVSEIGPLKTLLDQWQLPVVVANHNHPTQIVLSGATDAIEAVEAKLTEARVSFKRLKVATAFHSPVVSASAEPFATFLQDISFEAPSVPVYANSEAAPYPEDASAQRELLANQLARGVRFVEQVQAMAEAGARVFVEVGPGNVLGGLAARCLKDLPDVQIISLDQRGRHGVTSLLRGLGQLCAAGVSLELTALWEGVRAPQDPRAGKKRGFTVKLTGANYGKPMAPTEVVPLKSLSQKPAVAAAQPAPHKPAVAAAPVAPKPAAAPAPKAAPVIPPASVATAQQAFASAPAPAMQPTQPAQQAAQQQQAHAPVAEGPLVDAFERFQQRTAQTHQSYQQLMAENHMAFLEVARASFQGLAGQLSGAPIASNNDAPQRAPFATPASYVAPAPVKNGNGHAYNGNGNGHGNGHAAFAAPVAYAAPAAPAPAPAPAPVAAPAAAPVAVKPAAPVARPAPAPVASKPAAAPAPAAKAAPSVDLVPIMLEVVSEKTGYPTEMLNLGMELEADLGIDSIKRVEILSAMQEKVPSLPEVETSKMATLNTLQEIVDYMQSLLGPVSSAPTSAAPAPKVSHGAPAQPAQPASAGAGVNLVPIMLDVVSEKTGYPTEMLNLGMELEADLGIDSIKRVEILSAMQEKVPSLPEVETSKMATLNTLQEIVDYMQSLLGPVSAPASSAVTSAPAAHSAPAPAAQAGGRIDLVPIMLGVVSDKTGYPTEMLNLGMELEADLGIDSIKRVEILSAMQEQVPSLPEVETSKMATLNTLQEIVDYMGGLLENFEGAPSAMTSAAPAQGDAAQVDAAQDEIEGVARYEVRLVSAPAIGTATPGLAGGARCEVVSDTIGVSAALVALLNEVGVHASEVTSPSADAPLVIWLAGLNPTDDIDAQLALSASAFEAAVTVAASMTERGGAFITVQDTGGDFGLTGRAPQRAWLGGVPGVVKTANLEWPSASVKAIDLEVADQSPDQLAHRLLQELLAGGPEVEVALSADGARATTTSQLTATPALSAPMRSTDVVLVSGGARGVTARCVVALAAQSQARFVLLGRTQLSDEPACFHGIEDEPGLKRAAMQDAQRRGDKVSPRDLGKQVQRVLADREVRQTLADIEAAGGQAVYLAADVRDRDAVQGHLNGVRHHWGPITAIVHGAGVLADAWLSKKTREQFNMVFDTKVDGLRALLEVTAQDPLRALCMFSSVAGRTGNTGQSDYAMANETLNKVAQAQAASRGEGFIARSLGWGPWEAGMVTPALKAHFESQGVALIGLEAGAQAFAREMQSDAGGAVELVLGGGVGAQGLHAPLPEQGVALSLVVTGEQYPALRDHQIQGRVVLPVVQVLEWFTRLAQAIRPGDALAEVQQVRVLRGVFLDELDGAGHALRLRAVPDGDDALSLWLDDEQGKPRFGARAIFGQPTAQLSPLSAPLRSGRFDASSCYAEGALFHGPAFQTIHRLDGFSERGAAAVLTGSAERGWAQPTACDPARLDGALQLALLLGLEVMGAQTLPLGIGAWRKFAHTDGPTRCELVVTKQDKQRTVSDIRLIDAQGAVVAELSQVEMFMVPGGTDR